MQIRRLDGPSANALRFAHHFESQQFGGETGVGEKIAGSHPGDLLQWGIVNATQIAGQIGKGFVAAIFQGFGRTGGGERPRRQLVG